jgi:hypothetical protein
MSDALTPTMGGQRVLSQDSVWTAVVRHVPLILQLALATLVVHAYAIEGPVFFRLFVLTTAGFVVNLTLPLAWRLPFFVVLSAAGALLVFGAIDAAWLFACGVALIGICHLPLSFWVRAGLLVAAGAGLAVARAGLAPSPWSAAVWPILGSMFMFRLALYLLAVSKPDYKRDRGPWWALAYFFMLPNLVFPLFPVVDYTTLRRTYYDRAETGIYEQGMLWIARGLLHLLLYRFVYHYVLNDPTDVVSLGDLVQFMLGTFLLYLRVSGQFHLIVGLLHLFGFRLPETHKLYYLAHSFTELWRRINIYWTDFMMKTVFYPTYFRVKRLGPSGALLVSTVAVFLTTWILHSYQWFWLRGGFPLTAQDALFWGILGWLVVRGALKESTAAKKPKQGVTTWSWQLGLRAALTFSAFCFLWSLWSTESVTEWLWMIGAAARVDAKGVALVALTFAIIFGLGGRDWSASRPPQAGAFAFLLQPGVRATAVLLLLVVLAAPAVQANAPAPVAAGLAALHTTGLNARDAALQHRGYYEQLEVRPQVNAAVLDGRQRTGRWDDLASIGMVRDRSDLMLRDLQPSRSALWNGHSFSTNRWGMRDRDYTQEKPAGTLRIALLGPSHVMGNGVGDGETFEALVEDRLNREHVPAGYQRVEILNFAVDGYCLTQQLAMLEGRALGFRPDVVLVTHYQRNRLMTQGFLVRVAMDGLPVPYPWLSEELTRSGLSPMDRGRLPVPFSSGRWLAKLVGLDVRMPTGESEARARWIADEVLDRTLDRIAEVAKADGARPAVLALNAVIDDVPRAIPNRAAMARNGLTVLDLFDIFPEADRPRLRVAPWDDHPNAEGHRLIAERLYRQLVPLLDNVGAAAGAAPGTSQQ